MWCGFELGFFWSRIFPFRIWETDVLFLFSFPGDPQVDGQDHGAEDEQAPIQPEQHAQGGPTHEQAQPPKHTQVSTDNCQDRIFI